MKHQHTFRIATVLLLVLSLVSCADKPIQLTPLDNNAVILAFGDSLTFGTGANPKVQSYPAVLAQLIGLKIINAGIPGEVSQQGLKRLSTVLNETTPSLVILCHGGNDLIRNRGKKQLKDNLEQMIMLIKQSGAEVVLIGVPSFNLTLAVPALYEELAQTHGLPAELTILPRLERNPKMKSDQIHPNAAGYRLFAESIKTLLTNSGAL